ncbi:MAG: hypothetical protein QXI58_04135 [Candidatus Micrarchaeia archaeon]
MIKITFSCWLELIKKCTNNSFRNINIKPQTITFKEFTANKNCLPYKRYISLSEKINIVTAKITLINKRNKNDF